MNSHVKLKLSNSSDIPVVRFIGINFDGDQFLYDVNAGDHKHLSDVFKGYIGLTAYRVSDQQILGTISYPITDDMGFAAILLQDLSDPYRPYRLVGEAFVIPHP
jgi:hypothetical protein